MCALRKPVEKRDVETIERMKKVRKYPATHVASAPGRHKSTVDRARCISLRQQMLRRGRGQAREDAG